MDSRPNRPLSTGQTTIAHGATAVPIPPTTVLNPSLEILKITVLDTTQYVVWGLSASTNDTADNVNAGASIGPGLTEQFNVTSGMPIFIFNPGAADVVVSWEQWKRAQ